MASELEVNKVKSVSGTQTAELSGGELTLKRGSSTPTYINFPDSGASLQLRGPSYATAMKIDANGDLTQTATTPALIVKDTQDKSWAKNDALGSLQFHTSDTSGVGAHEIAGIHTETDEAGTNTQVAGAMVFKTAAYNNATPAERMRISSTGLAKFSNGITVAGENNWAHISGTDSKSLSLADDAQIQLADNEAGAMMIHIYDRGSGAGAVIFATYFGQPELVAGSTNYFDVADTDGKYCVIKSNSSHDVYFKNRSGTTRQFRILVTAGVLDNFV